MSSSAAKLIAALLEETDPAADKSARGLAKLLVFAHDDPRGYREWVGDRSVTVDASHFEVSAHKRHWPAWKGEFTVTAPDGVASKTFFMDITAGVNDDDDSADNMVRAADLAIRLAGLLGVQKFTVDQIDAIRDELELSIRAGDVVRLSPDGTIKEA